MNEDKEKRGKPQKATQGHGDGTHIDPVCNMEVGDTRFVLNFNAVTYYFCSKGCLLKFKNQNNYVNRHTYDLVIIGGGPAGLTSAVYAAISKIDTYLIARDIGGQAVDSTKIKNYMGYDFITGRELIDKFQNQFLDTNFLDHKIDEVIHITRDTEHNGFVLKTKSRDTVHTKAVIVATGMKQRKLGIPGEDKFQRRGVFYNSVQDMSLLAGKRVAVIGGGNSGAQTALRLDDLGCEVTLVTKGNLIADKRDIAHLERARSIRVIQGHDVLEIVGGDGIEELVIQAEDTPRKSRVPCEAVFIQVGFLPNTEFCNDLLGINGNGEIIIDHDCATNIRGIFACGDVTDVFGKRIIIAAGEGAKAALKVREYLANKRQD